MEQNSIFRFLFRLAADAHRLTRERLLRRLVTGLANYYNATTCRIYLASTTRAAASAADDETFEMLGAEGAQRLAAIEALLVQHARKNQQYVSALDLESDVETEEFLHDTLGVMDVFAFPLITGGEAVGSALLYLPNDSKPLGEADLQALSAVGEMLRVATETQLA